MDDINNDVGKVMRALINGLFIKDSDDDPVIEKSDDICFIPNLICATCTIWNYCLNDVDIVSVPWSVIVVKSSYKWVLISVNDTCPPHL